MDPDSQIKSGYVIKTPDNHERETGQCKDEENLGALDGEIG